MPPKQNPKTTESTLSQVLGDLPADLQTDSLLVVKDGLEHLLKNLMTAVGAVEV